MFALFTFLREYILSYSCFISSSSSPVLCLSAICRRTILILKRQNKCVNLSINSFKYSFFLFFLLFKKKQRITKTDNDDNKKKKNNNNNSKTVDQSSVTDESSFGSCEPGTSVVLQGIVWNETDKGK
jgi:hypothetical protein